MAETTGRAAAAPHTDTPAEAARPGFPPQVFLIGAQRSGTTFLASLLDQHPDVALARPKEPAFFTIRQQRGLDWYRARFPQRDDAVFVDATTWYSVAPTASYPQVRGDKDRPYIGVPERIHRLSPDARFLYLLREPVSRTYSVYWLLRRLFLERRSFAQALQEDPFYARSSDYSGQIANYLEYFPRERFKVLLFEDLVWDAARVVRECFEFMGVPPEACEVNVPRARRNEAFYYHRLGHLVGGTMRASLLVDWTRRGMRKTLPPAIAAALDRALFAAPIPPMTDEERALTERALAGANTNLEALTGIDPHRWSTTKSRP